MKRTLLVAALTALALAIYPGRFQAQGPTQAPTRVAVINIGLVFSKYDKALFYKKEMEDFLQPYKAQGAKLKSDAEKWQQEMKHPSLKKEERERYEQAILANKRKLEDLDREARAKVSKRQEDQIISLFRDVHDKVKAYAMNNGIHMVLAYGEQFEGDVYAFPNLNRKMQGMDLGSAHPLYVGAGIDISTAVIDVLNQSYRAAGGVVVPATPTSSGKSGK